MRRFAPVRNTVTDLSSRADYFGGTAGLGADGFGASGAGAAGAGVAGAGAGVGAGAGDDFEAAAAA